MAEGDMVAAQPNDLQPQSGPLRIDKPLHSVRAGEACDHMHPMRLISIAASKTLRGVDEADLWRRGNGMTCRGWPGFELGLAMQEIAAKNPK